MKWMVTVAFRWRPANMEWQYKTIITGYAPERWLAETLESARRGRGKLEASILYAREIPDEIAEPLEKKLLEAGPDF
ncbi:MAG TPA: hypothetical protein VEK15_10345 [Vicinamibacteria bacterium]|nr:hypothetical protein [Vicinamibacteria bacterium]